MGSNREHAEVASVIRRFLDVLFEPTRSFGELWPLLTPDLRHALAHDALALEGSRDLVDVRVHGLEAVHADLASESPRFDTAFAGLSSRLRRNWASLTFGGVALWEIEAPEDETALLMRVHLSAENVDRKVTLMVRRGAFDGRYRIASIGSERCAEGVDLAGTRGARPPSYGEQLDVGYRELRKRGVKEEVPGLLQRVAAVADP